MAENIKNNWVRGIIGKFKTKKEIKQKALEEADKIADKFEKSKGYVSSTKIPFMTTWSKDPSLLTEEEKKKAISRRSIRKQVIDTRIKQAKEKGVI